MSFQLVRPLPSPQEIQNAIPVPAELAAVKADRDRSIREVFDKKNSKFIVVIGPCSAHDSDAVHDYVCRLARVQESVKDSLVLIPRIYTNKPRTTGQGYKGMAHQPDHLKEPNIAEGIRAIREMHIRSLRDSHLTAADEMLYPINHPYLDDLLSYVAVGARSVENQHHRLTASGLDIPVGMKNPTSGDLQVMLNSIQAAQLPHVFSYNGWEVATVGNPFAHAILRGAMNHYGHVIPNYHYEDLASLAELYQKRGLANPTIFVDTNHDNSGKKHQEQPRIAMEIMRSRTYSPMLRKLVRGLVIESFIEPGSQQAGGDVYGQSITDPCLGWTETEELLKRIAESV